MCHPHRVSTERHASIFYAPASTYCRDACSAWAESSRTRKTRAELYYSHQCYNRELITATVTGPWGLPHMYSRAAQRQPTFVWPCAPLGVGARRHPV